MLVVFFFQLKMTYHELTVFRINFRKKIDGGGGGL